MKLLFLLLCIGIANAEYLLVHPRYVEAGKETSVCLTLNSMNPDFSTGQLTVQYFRNDTKLPVSIEKIFDFVINQEDIHVCNAITPPSEPGTYDLLMTVTVESFTGMTTLVVDEKAGTVEVRRADLITLIQTDKGIYKPGQTVKIRAITMNYDLLFQTNFSQITVESPNGLRMAQWDELKPVNGLVSLQMPLSTDPELGTWMVKVVTMEGKEVIETFKVEEYVLPKYEVTITPPAYLLTTSRTISGTVCAKYTYGKPVKGFLSLNICYKSYSMWVREQRPCATVLHQIDGCYEFVVDSEEIELGNRNFSTYGELKLNATVTEKETGVTLTGEATGPSVSINVLNLELQDDSNNFFKPGFPYRGRVIVTNPDKSPAPGEEIKVTARRGAYWGEAEYSRTFLSDDNGLIHFVMPDMAKEHGTWRISAEAVVYESDWRYYYYDYWYRPSHPSASVTIKKWTSPSNSYIYIPDVDNAVECDSEVVLDVYYTTPPGPTYTFTAMLQAGSVIKSTKIFTETSTENIIDIVSVDSTQILEKIVVPPTPEPTLPPTPDYVYYTEVEPVEEEIPPLPEDVRKKRGAVSPSPEVPTVEDSSFISMFKMPVYVSQDMSPDVSVLLYYVREDKEVVSTSINIKVKSCFRNKASMSFSEKTVQPGETVNLNLGAAPTSTCFVGMVDKSVNLIGGYNQLTPAKVFENVRRVSRPSIWTYYYDEDYKYCKEKHPEEEKDPDDYYYHARYEPDGVDAVQPFRDMNMLVLTDATLQTRPCKREEHRIVYYMHREVGMPGLRGPLELDGATGPLPLAANQKVLSSDKPSPPRVRSLFPETWLWDMFQIGDEGQSTFELTVPDTITEWVGNTLCSHPEVGVGLTDLTRVTVFQPFFVSLNLPYSVIRGETVPLTITVFNYLENCLTMSVVLRETEGYELPQGVTETNMCVCGGDSESVKFYIIPTLIGEIDIEVVAYSVEDTGLCTNVVLSTEGVGVSDGVQRQLLVEAEGVPQVDVVSSYICMKDESSFKEWVVDLNLPDNLVPESDRARVSVVGDVMGPTLSNLKNLLRMPYGCGEQNMASWSPNIYVMQYLTATGQSTDKLEDEATGYMTVGYQRQMKYRHSDYSYSAFGENSYYGEPHNGSLWLTAFVVKSMAQSAHFISIDETTIMQSVNFIRSIQQESGCFPQYGKVFSSYMKGGLADGDNPAGLTAFVLIALLETDLLDLPEVNMTIYKGFQCLDGFSMSDIDTYTLAIMSYAYSLANESFIPEGRMDEILSEIEKRAHIESGLKYWEREGQDNTDKDMSPWYRAPSANIEMTAYILMTYLKDGVDVIGQVQPIVQWITKQRNPYGGFSSTQDTVVALQALDKFATLTYSGENSVTVKVSSGKVTSFQVTNDNSLLYQSVPVYPKDGPVHINTMGKGCVLVQVSMFYNVYKEDKSEGPAFNVSVDVHRIRNERNACDKRNIQVCASYLKPGGLSNMAIIEVKLPSGWSPDSDSLKQVLGVSRTEVDNGKVDLYFDELTSRQTCVVFKVQQDIEMNTKPALVRVYDYYETAYEVTVPYSISTGCGTKEDIPKNNEGLDCLRVQCRETVPSLEPELPSCPQCPGSMELEDFKDTVCNATAVYKAWVGRTGMYPIKLKANLRTRKKEDLSDFVFYKMDSVCSCPIIQESKEMKAFILVSDDEAYDTRKKVIDLDSQVTILKFKKQWEREVRILSTRQKACKKLARLRRKAEKLRKKKNRHSWTIIRKRINI